MPAMSTEKCARCGRNVPQDKTVRLPLPRPEYGDAGATPTVLCLDCADHLPRRVRSAA